MGLYRISGEALIFNNQQNRRPLLSTTSGLPVRITLWMSLADMIGSLGITVHAYFSTSDNKILQTIKSAIFATLFGLAIG